MKIKLKDVNEDSIEYIGHLVEMYIAWTGRNASDGIVKRIIGKCIDDAIDETFSLEEVSNKDSVVFAFDGFSKLTSYIKKEGDDVFISDDISEFDYDTIVSVRDPLRFVNIDKNNLSGLFCECFSRMCARCWSIVIRITPYHVPEILSLALGFLLEYEKDGSFNLSRIISEK